MSRDEPPVVSAVPSTSTAASAAKATLLESSRISGMPTVGVAEKRKRLRGAEQQLLRREQMARRTGMGGSGKGGADPLDPSSYSDAPRWECDAAFVARPGAGQCNEI